MSPRQFLFGALLLCAADLTCHTAAAQSFITFDVPQAGTGLAQGTAGLSINDSGAVAGVYLLSGIVGHGFVRSSSGVITTFDVPGAGTGSSQGTFPISINANGAIAGVYFDANNLYHGFVRTPDGTITTFDVPGAGTTGHKGTMPLSINAGGDITGLYKTEDTVCHAFIRSASGAITTFDIPGAGTNYAQGTIPVSINAAGAVTGFYADLNDVTHVFVRSPDGSVIAPIDPPGVSASVFQDFEFPVATSINSLGDIAGSSIDQGGVLHGFVRTADGTITTFDVPGAAAVLPTSSGAYGGFEPPAGTLGISINDAREIAGFYADSNYLYHAFIRAADGSITAPLDAPGAAASSANVLAGTLGFGINATGAITGTYADSSGTLHGFIRTAPPSPPTIFQPGNFTLVQGASVSVGSLTLVMQGDGNLVLYGLNGTPVWSTGTYGQDCGSNQCSAVFQADGNFVVYNGSTPLWNSGTFGNPSAQLILSAQTPQLEIIGSNGSPLWSNLLQFSGGTFRLAQGASFAIGSLSLVMQGDGDLVLYQPNGTAIWSTGTYGQNCGSNQCYAIFQADGDFVVYNGPTPLWNSGTFGNPGAQLILSAQAPQLEIIGSNGSLLWSDVLQFSAGTFKLAQARRWRSDL